MKQKLVLGVALAASLAVAAHAYIEVLYPLQQFLKESEVVAEGVVEKVDPKTRACVIRITKSLKGKCAYEKLRVNVGAGKEWHPEAAMRHLVEGSPVALLYNAEKRAELYVNRFFLQMNINPESPADNPWWNFANIEIYCNRTYNGPAAEFIKLLDEVLSGERKAPPPAPKRPAIRKEDVEALPAPGQAVDPEKLPPPFKA